MRRKIALIMGLVLFLGILTSVPLKVKAYYVPSESEFVEKLNELRNKYPNGGTWSGAYKEGNIEKAWECFGYANQMLFEVFGIKFYDDGFYTKKDYNIGTIYAGDWIRLDAGAGPETHSVFVTKVTDERIYFTDANFRTGSNNIRWDVFYTREEFSRRFAYKIHVPGNTLTGNGSTGFPVSTEVSGSTTVTEGIYTLSPACASGRCLDICDASNADGANAWLYQSNGTSAQRFTFEYIDSNCYKITAACSGMVLDAYGYGTEPGTNVIQSAYHGGFNQRWLLFDAGEGYYYICPRINRNLYLDVCNAEDANGTNIWLWEGNQTGAQKWKLTKVGDITPQNRLLVSASTEGSMQIPEGTYTLSPACKLGSVLDIADASKKDGANVQLCAKNGHDAQKFRFEYLGNNNYKIVSAYTGLALDAYGYGTQPGTNVIQSAFHGGSNQRWAIYSAGDGTCYIRPLVNTNLTLNASDLMATGWANAKLTEITGSDTQRWKINELDDNIFKLNQDKICTHSKKKYTVKKLNGNWCVTCNECGGIIPQNKLNTKDSGRYSAKKTAPVCLAPYNVSKVKTVKKNKSVLIVGSVTNVYGNKWLKTSDGYYIYSKYLKKK